MGDKNNIARITCADVQLKTGHGVLKAAYVSTPGTTIFEIIDGTLDSDPTLMSIDCVDITSGYLFLAPYLNHPVNKGLRVQVVSGSGAELVVIYE